MFGEWAWLMKDGSLAVNDAKGGRKPSTKLKKIINDGKFKNSKRVFSFGEKIPVMELLGIDCVIAETVWKKG